MRITNDALDAICWDGTNTAEVEAFAGVRCVDATTVLVVPTTDDPREGLLGREPLHVANGGWLVRANDRLRVLPPDAAPALHESDAEDDAGAPATPEGTAA